MKNVSEITRDHMPASVATDLLCTKPRITNRERKTYMDARCKAFESVLRPLPIEEKLNRKLQKAAWKQLQTWNRRAQLRREDAQRAYLLAECRLKVLKEKYETTETGAPELNVFRLGIVQMDKVKLACDLKAQQLDVFRDAIEQELDRRKENFKPVTGCPVGEPRNGSFAK